MDKRAHAAILFNENISYEIRYLNITPPLCRWFYTTTHSNRPSYSEKELEGGRFLHLVGGIPGIYLAPGQCELHDFPRRAEIEFVEVYPKYIGT